MDAFLSDDLGASKTSSKSFQPARLAARSKATRPGLIATVVTAGVLSALACGTNAAAQPSSAPATQPGVAQTQPSTDTASRVPPPTGAAAAFKKMSLDELLDIEVTSVSKRQSTVGDSPAAISVITQDDIHRSGSSSIPEALRLAPGLEVAQISANGWGISARGFNSQDANKLLVLVDGRSVYTPLFGGVFWDVQDTMMEDIDRIEVIRGPAGSLWGENAVNGVINVMTKSAQDTQGYFLSAGGGTFERAFAEARYGWQMGDDAFARVYVKHFERDQTLLADSSGGGDAWQMTQAGFRMDWQPSTTNHYSVHGDIYGGYENNLVTVDPGDTSLSGGNIVGLWTHDLGAGGDLKLQAYYDRTNHNMLPFSEHRDTFDVDFQHHVRWDPGQDFTWGLGYRWTIDRLGLTPTIFFDPDRRATQVISAFAQYEAQLVPDRLRLTLGSKLDHNDFSGFEVQPNARLLWNITKQQSVWGAVSRAVRTPTRLDEDVQVAAPLTPGTETLIVRGSHDFHSESVIAYEMGYRVEPIKPLSIDVATFYNVYSHLQSLDTITSLAQLPYVFGNEAHGDTYGVEIGATLKAADWWTIRGSYTYLRERLVASPGNMTVPQSVIASDDPNNQLSLRSSMDFPHHVQLDLTARYVEELSTFGVPSYIAVDGRLSWQPTEHLELAVVAKNMFDDQHPEFHGNYSTASVLHEIPRSVYGTVTYTW